MPLHKPTIAWSVFGTLTFLGFVAWLPFFAIQFKELFADAGTRLPRITSALVNWPLTVSVCLLALAIAQASVLAAYIGYRSEVLRKATWALFAFDIVIVASIVFSFYLPIEQLGSRA